MTVSQEHRHKKHRPACISNEVTRPEIRKVVYPVAGLGTWFLPATKAMPKELLPIIDKPMVQYALEEAIAAGITDLIFVTGRTKRAIEALFDANPALEWALRAGTGHNLLRHGSRPRGCAKIRDRRAGLRYDCGSKVGYLEAVVDFVLEHPDYEDRFLAMASRKLAVRTRFRASGESFESRQTANNENLRLESKTTMRAQNRK